MKKLWKVMGVIALISLILGVVLVGAGFFTGGSPVTIADHGDIDEYLRRLQINGDILQNGIRDLFSRLGF